MRRAAAVALVALMGIGASGCSTNGQPNNLEFLGDQAEVIETLRVLGILALSYDPYGGRYGTISSPSLSSPGPSYTPSATIAHEDAYIGSSRGRPRSNYGNLDNPFNDTKSRNRSGGFRNSWRHHNGDCSPQPTCTLR